MKEFDGVSDIRNAAIDIMEEGLISLAIHTYEHAMALKRVLEAHHIKVMLQKFVVDGVPFAVGVKVMIPEKDLPLAIKITESVDHPGNLNLDSVLTGNKGELLIPIDFNDYCIEACKAGFDLAERLNLTPIILHAYPTPIFNSSFITDDITSVGVEPSLDEEISDLEVSKGLEKQGKSRMKDLIMELKSLQEDRQLPDIKFNTRLEDGVPEDVIKDFCRLNSPALVVMVTRGKVKKDEQLIGSVTAEVLDDCRVPVFSIPENYNFKGINSINELVFFCNMDQHDLISVDTFMRMFEYPEVNITLIPIVDKQDKNLKTKLMRLKDYFSKSYPAAHFTTAIFGAKTFMADFNNYESQRGIEMIIVPNRRRNAIMRLFNPGIAHRLLFERDLPLLALPI